MRYFVLTPLAAFLLLMLLLLMVHLAGLNRPSISKPIQLSDAPFELNQINFEKQSLEPQAEVTPLSPPELPAVTPEPTLEALLETAELPEPELLEPELLEPQVDLSAELKLDVELLDNVLDSVAVAPPKPVVKKQLKKVVKKKVQKRVTAKPRKATAKPRPEKTVKRASRQSQTRAAAAKTPSQSASNSGSNTAKATTPTALRKVKPKYPSRARRRGIEGEVVVAFKVSPAGTVLRNSIKVVSAKPAKVFNKAVVAAVSRWRFAKSNGGYKTTQKLVFSLTK